MWQTLLGSIMAIGLGAVLVRQFLDANARQRVAAADLLGGAAEILEKPHIDRAATAGVHRLTGVFDGLPVQVQTVADTLAMRKLPSLWLMVTIPAPLPVGSTFDMMMRAAGPASFSNFDQLPETIARPPDFPEHAVIRTDDASSVLPAQVVRKHLGLFFDGRAKELLISPKGLRLVTLIAEGDRARYGVFRQADFGAARVDATLLRNILEMLSALRSDIEAWHRSKA